MNKFLYISALVLSALACGATLPQNQLVIPTSNEVYFTPTSEPTRMIVTAETLQIRDGAGEEFTPLGHLEDGQIVTCSDTKTAKDGGLWCKHELGWSNTRYMKGIK